MALLGCLDRFDNTIAGWAFDPEMPGEALDITVETSGREIYRSSANLYRADLLNAIGECDHGFSFDLLVAQPEASDLVIDIFAHGKEKKLLGGGFWKSTDVAVTGRFGWLFLNTDSNDVNAVISGEKRLCDAQISATSILLATRSAMLRQMKVEYQAVIMPEKNVVCAQHKFNSIISDERPAVSICRLAKQYGSDVIYPLAEFLDGGPYFHKTDTHANAAGYAQLLSTLMKSNVSLFGKATLPEPTQNPAFCGDLGNKFNPKKFETTSEYKFPIHKRGFSVTDPIPKILESGETLKGSVVKTLNEEAPNGTAILFGTSSAYGFLPLLSTQFKKIIFVWEYTLDYALIARTRPDFVLLIISERFLPISCNDITGLPDLDDI
jgi:hypothetical protein